MVARGPLSRRVAAVAAVCLCASGPLRAEVGRARRYLEEARAATLTIHLDGDRSAALREVAQLLARLDAQEALNAVAGMRRPSDAARALGRAAVATAPTDPAAAADAVGTAGRLLLRVADPDHRAAEQRLLAGEVAALGPAALAAAVELPEEEAKLAVVLGLADSDPPAALRLHHEWGLSGAEADRAVARAAARLAPQRPEEALEAAARVHSARLHDHSVWLVAQHLPPAEAAALAPRIADPLARAAAQTSAARRLAAEDAEAALAMAGGVGVAAGSAVAEVAAALAAGGDERGLEAARGLPERARAWALSVAAVALADRDHGRAARLLAEAGAPAEAVRAAVARIAASDPLRARELAEALLEGEAREAALAAVAAAAAVAAERDPGWAKDVLWAIESPEWRDRAAGALARRRAEVDWDEATAMVGLVSDAAQVQRIRAEVAVVVARHDPRAALAILESLPPSRYRAEGALAAGRAALAAGRTPEEGLRLARAGLERGLALRWLLPALARTEAVSPLNLAATLEDSYLRALGLVDLAREELGAQAAPRATPERAQQIRIIVEWEGA